MNLANRVKRIEEQFKPEVKDQESEWDMSPLSKEELLRIIDLTENFNIITTEEYEELLGYLEKCPKVKK